MVPNRAKHHIFFYFFDVLFYFCNYVSDHKEFQHYKQNHLFDLFFFLILVVFILLILARYLLGVYLVQWHVEEQSISAYGDLLKERKLKVKLKQTQYILTVWIICLIKSYTTSVSFPVNIFLRERLQLKVIIK